MNFTRIETDGKLAPQKLYGAIRQTDGRQWVDVDTLSAALEVSESKAKQTDKEIPHWAITNPVVRYGAFTLV